MAENEPNEPGDFFEQLSQLPGYDNAEALIGELLSYLTHDELEELLGVEIPEEPDEIPPLPPVDEVPDYFWDMFAALNREPPTRWRRIRPDEDPPTGVN